MANIIWQSQNSASRIWAANTLPQVKPSGFTKFDYFFQGNDEKTYNWIQNRWEVSHLQFVQPTQQSGSMPTIVVDSTNTLASGLNATVENVGTANDLKLKFGIPQGIKGDKGDTATIQIANISATTLNSTNAAQVSIIDSDPSPSNANLSFNFGIPQGAKGDKGDTGIGLPGQAATVSIGNVTTLSAGSNATVTNSGTANAAILNFGIPRGADGASGSGSSGGINVGFIRYVTTAAELNSAWAGVVAGTVRSIHLAANITLTQTLVLPANYNKILEIEGHGAELTVPSSLTNGAIYRAYASLSEANAGIDCQLRIRNVVFKSSGRAVPAINMQANYGTKIEGCRFENFASAIKGGWTMGTIIEQCYFWENNISIELDYARFTGGSNSASQSNHSVIRDCKFRHSAGQFGAIKATAVSGLHIIHNIFEGVQAGPQYEVYFDDGGSNVVKEFTCYANHVEQQASVAAFYIRLKDGFAYCGGIYSQYDCTLIKFEGAGYGKCIAENIPYLTSGTKFENVLSAGRWEFINPPATFVNTDATKWVGAMPTNLAIKGWDTNGQKSYMQGVTIK